MVDENTAYADNVVPGYPLRACYRLQFHADFTLDDACAQVEYLAALGVSHIYASPLWASRQGSTHGYDGIDPTRLDPEIGDEEALERLVERLRSFGMGLIVDFVPNHLAVGGSENHYWQDVLRWGQQSRFAPMFDIEWIGHGLPELEGKLLVPFLGRPYGEVLAEGELRLALDEDTGLFHIAYFEHCFPIDPRTCSMIFKEAGLDAVAHACEQIPHMVSLEAGAARAGSAVMEARHTEQGHQAIDALLASYQGQEADAHARLHLLLEQQNYRLAYWRTANDQLNWRRFFDITELGAVCVDNPTVFTLTHTYLLELVARGLVDGVRLDHVDGLADPAGYCRQLRQRLDEATARRPAQAIQGPLPILIEKILEADETLPTDWGISGTTGYEFMNAISLLQHDPEGEAALTALWQAHASDTMEFDDEVIKARREIMATALVTEFQRAVRALVGVAQCQPGTRDITIQALGRATRAVAAHFPVYRSYADDQGWPAAEVVMWEATLDEARSELAPPDHAALEYMAQWLGRQPPSDAPQIECDARMTAIIRFAQLTSPLAAKAVEDTAGYRRAVLISRNDVGFNGARMSAPVADFHAFNQHNARTFPHTLVTTATHDHKRGEDVRARLAVLSETGQGYRDLVTGWLSMSGDLQAQGRRLVEADEMMLYQIIVGAWPLSLTPDDQPGLNAFAERVANWQQKALREAKQRSHWLYPDEVYEAACRDYVMALLTTPAGAVLRGELASLVTAISTAGALNGLVQTLLRLTVPGVPDCYQGTERWDFSLVDPDNRRPVDYGLRRAQQHDARSVVELLPGWRDGRVKQAMIMDVLALRHRFSTLFAEGQYLPLEVTGSKRHHVVAFARQHQNQMIIVVTVRHMASMLKDATMPQVAPDAWGDTRLDLTSPGSAWSSWFTRKRVSSGGALSELLAELPFCILVREVRPDAQGEQAMAEEAVSDRALADLPATDSMH
ncbi:malto-oligosyltrehalose synthase [Larsenimonas rhizosphaerae]|uniref:Malto-oligosyltrehalose synthase n=1 Tax=Larsenimonas rhizosphaerae TaxID=2944682 RepID=A0AA41ZED9_9GAMM|nr:malto-oligosyltrehalose synthase [Larsenimonas rhizosphaerae]MCX2522955.1 malto-oligosyltrehalose synthase [Larsenimonas rhizosphaerae]